MSCARLEWTCEIATDAAAAQEDRACVASHAGACAECADLLSAIARLESAGAVFAAPDPGARYWASFPARLGRRIDGGARYVPAPWRTRLTLAFAASFLLLVVFLSIRSLGTRPGATATGGGAQDTPSALETELLETLGQAEPDTLREVLDGVLPAEDPTYEDLASAMASLNDESGPNAPFDSPYDLFLDLPDDARGRLLKEIRGEIG